MASRYAIPGEQSAHDRAQAAIEGSNRAYREVLDGHRRAVFGDGPARWVQP